MHSGCNFKVIFWIRTSFGNEGEKRFKKKKKVQNAFIDTTISSLIDGELP
jgi:hypothetical protein